MNVTTMRTDPAAGTETMRLYHDETKLVADQPDGPGHYRRRSSRLVQGFTPLDPSNRPDPFKRYPDAARIELPRDFSDSAVSAADVLSGHAHVEPEPLDLERLARLLFFSAGVTRTLVGRETRVTMYARVAPSAGNLHPVDLYVVAAGMPGLDAGLYHFTPLDFVLERLHVGDVRSSVATGLGDTALVAAPLFLILTGIPFRTAWKYSERGLRHLYWDAGTMLANLMAVAEASGWSTSVRLGFVDEEVCALLGLDGVGEFPLAIVQLVPSDDRQHLPKIMGAGLTSPPLTLTSTPVAPAPVEFPLLTDAQHAGDLPNGDALSAWRERASTVGWNDAATGIEEPGSVRDESIEVTILRRGSTRLMRPQTVPRELLDWPMAVATRPFTADFVAPGRSLLDHYVDVHGLQDTAPGFYRWQQGALIPLLVEDEVTVRRRSYRLCLEQPLGGDSAYTVYHCADLDRLLPALGARGYRAAQLEAGVVAGRLGLAAFTMGYGATELTFLDDDVAETLGPSANCMLVTSVGVPAYKSKRGGRPGQPTELTAYSNLMARFQSRFDEASEPRE